MAIEILLPRLGWTMVEGVFDEWQKHAGDVVHSGDPLFTIESDKATVEVETFESGFLRVAPDGPQPGSMLPVGTVLGYLVQSGERAPFETTAQNRERAPAGSTENRESEYLETRHNNAQNGHPSPITQHATPIPPRNWPTISPRGRLVAYELGIYGAALAGGGSS